MKMILIKNVNENKNKLLLFLRPKICRIKMSKIAEIVIEKTVDKKNMYPINPSQDKTLSKFNLMRFSTTQNITWSPDKKIFCY